MLVPSNVRSSVHIRISDLNPRFVLISETQSEKSCLIPKTCMNGLLSVKKKWTENAREEQKQETREDDNKGVY